MNGVINVLKPPGMTSHDVISFLRRELHEKKIGHAGTLDPQAAGVLPVCVGQATRLVEYLSAASKEYLCHVTFGVTTTTQDAWGEVENCQCAEGLELDSIREVLPSFIGEITQITPAYSAVKVKGVPLYKLARQGKEIEVIPRQVTIHYLQILDYQTPVLSLLVGCSKGTYIRTLCHDLGQAVGLGGNMSFLLRTKVGGFSLAESHTLEEISALKEKVLLPLEYCVSDLPKIVLKSGEMIRLKQGQRVECGAMLAGTTVAVFDEAGIVQAIADVIKGGTEYYLKPRKVLDVE